MLWHTKITVRPYMGTSPILTKHFFWNAASPTAQDFVHKKDFGFEMRGDGEGEAHSHAAAVVLEGRVDEALDFVEFADDFRFAHAEDRAADETVFAAGQFRVKAGADFEQAGDASVEFGESDSGPRDARQQFEQRRLARPFLPIGPTTSPCLTSKEMSRTAISRQTKK